MSKLDQAWQRFKDVPEIKSIRLKKHQLFVLAYAMGETRGNGAASYRAAGYKASPKSREGARTLLRRPEIKAALDVLTSGSFMDVKPTGQSMTPGERLAICAQIARDQGVAPRARLAAIRLDAELRGGFKAQVEDIDIVVDLVKPTEPPEGPQDPEGGSDGPGPSEGPDKPGRGRGGLRIAT